MKCIRHLSMVLIALFTFAGRAYASDNTLAVNITVTIAQLNEIEWVDGTLQTDQDGNRAWALSNVALNTAYLSSVSTPSVNVMTEAGGGNLSAARGTCLDIRNLSTTPVSLAIQAVSAVWAIGATTGSNQYMLEFSNNNGGAFTALVENTSATLIDPVAGSATQTFDLRLTTPLTVTSVLAAGTCTVTITSTLK